MAQVFGRDETADKTATAPEPGEDRPPAEPTPVHTPVRLVRGHRKDHRPDVNQVKGGLAVSADGGVPWRWEAQDGNQADVSTSVESWLKVQALVGRTDFLCVGDCTLAAQDNLVAIIPHQGRCLAPLPGYAGTQRQREGWVLTKTVEDLLRRREAAGQEGWYRGVRRPYALLDPASRHDPCEVHVVCNPRVQAEQPTSLERRLQKTQGFLEGLPTRLSTRGLKRREAIDKATWLGGYFPLITNGPALTTPRALRIYQEPYHPEERFTWLKGAGILAPLLVKTPHRIEALFFVVGLVLQLLTVVEREVAHQITASGEPVIAGFLSGLVEWLAARCRLKIKVAQPGEHPVPGTIYFPQEHTHLEIDGQGSFMCSLAPPVGGHRPSVTVTFRSVARYYGSQDIIRGLQAGADNYLTKPYDAQEVLTRIAYVLTNRQPRTSDSVREGIEVRFAGNSHRIDSDWQQILDLLISTFEKAVQHNRELRRAMEDIQRLAKQLEIHNTFIRETFGRYMTEEVVASLLDSPTGLTLGGEPRKVTILMFHLRGFTSLLGRMPPEQVVAILNRYLATMVDVIMQDQGTINEFLGDAIFVIFGAPVWREDHAQRGVACAMAM